MGAIAEGFVAYAQPLLEETDGSEEELNKAFEIAQLCYNLAILPEASREEMLGKMQQSLAMDDEEFEAFRNSLVDTMIRRHEEMFPRMHGWMSASRWDSDPLPRSQPIAAEPIAAVHAAKRTVVDRYAPCPCNSGKKYKFCCGAKRR